MPDAYRFILIDNSLVKLFSSWNGGYLTGDEWRLNSGCVSITAIEDGLYDVAGYSGSVYSIHKDQSELNSYTNGVYRDILDKLTKAGVPVKELTLEEAIDKVNTND